MPLWFQSYCQLQGRGRNTCLDRLHFCVKCLVTPRMWTVVGQADWTEECSCLSELALLIPEITQSTG